MTRVMISRCEHPTRVGQGDPPRHARHHCVPAPVAEQRARGRRDVGGLRRAARRAARLHRHVRAGHRAGLD